MYSPCRLVYSSCAFICHKAAYVHELCHAAVETLHDQLRDCVDLMGIGLGGSRADTVAEEGTAITKDQPKDIGDVRSALHPACISFILIRQQALALGSMAKHVVVHVAVSDMMSCWHTDNAH